MTETSSTRIPLRDGDWPDPPASPDSAPFVAAAREGRFLLRRCAACGKAHWYPRALCPFCFGETAWEEASGEGTIYSYTVLAREDPPRTVAYVTLAEGPTMLTSLVDCDPQALAISLPVQLVFASSRDGTPVPCFRPAGAGDPPEPAPAA
ncbi:Zn-ribbon domain-containing OB-fold protein [Methylobacterium sp. SyP6R]|uniref:Zn-ribbon domain-containing OB-fold protein n=1 Tax=Methylobacterium sp. SyP6R TaxID=2718876 RepID=UPI001F22ECFE|nr:OB-fold domain-containing protein [Methylobacterium sp. SyP6R]MCF4123928.1 OB-fold domain-containing protein [Methylobacterium sp. SyP6R]